MPPRFKSCVSNNANSRLICSLLYSDDAPPNYLTTPDREFDFTLFHGEPIEPNEGFAFVVQFRFAGADDDEWLGTCEPVIASTNPLPLGQMVALLPAPHPRIFLLDPVMFHPNSPKMQSDSADRLVAVAKLLKQHKELRIAIEGHVNFGQVRPTSGCMLASLCCYVLTWLTPANNVCVYVCMCVCVCRAKTMHSVCQRHAP